MLNHRRIRLAGKTLAAIVLVAAMMGAEGGCQPRQQPTAEPPVRPAPAPEQDTKPEPPTNLAPPQCDTRIRRSSPQRIPYRGDVAIIGTASSQCDAPQTVVKHRVSVYLERYVKGGWTWRENWLGGGGRQVCTKIPNPAVWTNCTRTFTGCYPGRWRVRVEVDWTVSNGRQTRSGKFDVPELPEREITCPGPEG